MKKIECSPETVNPNIFAVKNPLSTCEYIAEKFLTFIICKAYKRYKTIELGDSLDFDETKELRLLKKAKTKRFFLYKHATAWFMLYFVLLLVLKFIHHFAFQLLGISLPENIIFIFKGLTSVIDLINIAFSALIGALIGFVLNEGIDTVRNWCDKDIIDEFILKDLDKDLSSLIDESKKKKVTITHLEGCNNESVITKYVYSDAKEEEDLAKTKSINGKELKPEEIRNKLYYLIEINDDKFMSNLAYIVSFTTIIYISKDQKEVQDPYVYINSVLVDKQTRFVGDIKDKCAWSTCNNLLEPKEIKFCEHYSSWFFNRHFCRDHQTIISNIKENCREKSRFTYASNVDTEDINEIQDYHLKGIVDDLNTLPKTKDYIKCIGIKNLVAGKSVIANENDLVHTRKDIYDSLTALISVLRIKDNKPTAKKDKNGDNDNDNIEE